MKCKGVMTHHTIANGKNSEIGVIMKHE
jgi:hypothetical protein